MTAALKLIAAKEAIRSAGESLQAARRTLAEAHATLGCATPRRVFGLEEDIDVLMDLLGVAMALSIKGDPRAEKILMALDGALDCLVPSEGTLELDDALWTAYEAGLDESKGG